jgi:hypothetical protein
MVRYFCRWCARRLCGVALGRPRFNYDELSTRKGQGQGICSFLGYLPVWLVHGLHHSPCNQHSLRRARRRVNCDVFGMIFSPSLSASYPGLIARPTRPSSSSCSSVRHRHSSSCLPARLCARMARSCRSRHPRLYAQSFATLLKCSRTSAFSC